MTDFQDEGRDYRLAITVDTRYLDADSSPADERYAFAYTIRIRNEGAVPARLLGRRWVITDAVGDVREVDGEGVVGEQPWLRPGEEYTYTSGAVLPTPIGTMYGSYRMLADDGTRFDAPIPAFTLCVPHSLH
jgi:ApaG protein